MKILLLGKNGQVGQELQRTLLPLGTVTALGRADLNFEDTANIESVLKAHAPDLIVNAAAYTAVDKAESDSERAFRVNAEAVGTIAHFARRHACDAGSLFDGLCLRWQQRCSLPRNRRHRSSKRLRPIETGRRNCRYGIRVPLLDISNELGFFGERRKFHTHNPSLGWRTHRSARCRRPIRRTDLG